MFLKILLELTHCDSLWFLWLNFDSNEPDVYIYQFTRVFLG